MKAAASRLCLEVGLVQVCGMREKFQFVKFVAVCAEVGNQLSKHNKIQLSVDIQ